MGWVSLVGIVGVTTLGPAIGPVPLDQFHSKEGGGDCQHDRRKRGDGHVDIAHSSTEQAGPVTDALKERGDRWHDQPDAERPYIPR